MGVEALAKLLNPNPTHDILQLPPSAARAMHGQRAWL
jgi:hypothetical protein